MSRLAGTPGRAGTPAGSRALAGGRRGQALAELAVAVPLLVVLAALPLVAFRSAERRLLALSAAREAAWAAAVPSARRPSPTAGVRVVVTRGRRTVRAVATAHGGAGGSLGPAGLQWPIAAPAPVPARLELRSLPAGAATEAAARSAVARRWLGGAPGVPVRAALRRLLADEPLRIDFDARPVERGR